jgi:hypothetical protein
MVAATVLRLRLNLSDCLFQGNPCDQDIRLVQRWVSSTHFRNKRSPRALAQHPARFSSVAIERTHGLCDQWIKVRHSGDLP